MPRWIRCLAATALLTLPAAVVAQDSMHARVDAQATNGRPPSPGVALTLSVIGTAIPVAMMAGGVAGQDGGAFITGFLAVIPGPSVGYFYGGRPWRGLASTGLRLVGATGLAGSALICWNGCHSGSQPVWAAVTGVGGLALMVGASVFDVARVDSDVRRANARRAARLAPTVDVTDGGMRLGLAVRF